jgi:hypothetical protein
VVQVVKEVPVALPGRAPPKIGVFGKVYQYGQRVDEVCKRLVVLLIVSSDVARQPQRDIPEECCFSRPRSPPKYQAGRRVGDDLECGPFGGRVFLSDVRRDEHLSERPCRE